MSGWRPYFGVFYLLYKIQKTTDYKSYTATPRTTKEKFHSSRIKTTDIWVFKKLFQQQNMIIKERISHYIWGKNIQLSVSPVSILHPCIPTTGYIQAKERNHRVLITETPAFLGAHKTILWSPIDQQETRKAQLLPDSLHRKENNWVHEQQ